MPLIKCWNPSLFLFSTEVNLVQRAVEPVKPGRLLDYAQLEIVHGLHSKVHVHVLLVQRGGQVLGAAEAGDGTVHLVKEGNILNFVLQSFSVFLRSNIGLMFSDQIKKKYL